MNFRRDDTCMDLLFKEKKKGIRNLCKEKKSVIPQKMYLNKILEKNSLVSVPGHHRGCKV